MLAPSSPEKTEHTMQRIADQVRYTLRASRSTLETNVAVEWLCAAHHTDPVPGSPCTQARRSGVAAEALELPGDLARTDVLVAEEEL